MHEKRAVALIGAEHYLDAFANLNCFVMPIWGAWSNIVGVINITGSEEFKSPLIAKKLTTAASKIENRLFFEAHRENNIFKIHYDADFIDTHLGGLVAINAFGDILSATRHALEMLDPLDPFGKRCNVSELFFGDFSIVDDYCL